MRILLTNTGPRGTGSGTVADGVMQELTRRGHEVMAFFLILVGLALIMTSTTCIRSAIGLRRFRPPTPAWSCIPFRSLFRILIRATIMTPGLSKG